MHFKYLPDNLFSFLTIVDKYKSHFQNAKEQILPLHEYPKNYIKNHEKLLIWKSKSFLSSLTNYLFHYSMVTSYALERAMQK